MNWAAILASPKTTFAGALLVCAGVAEIFGVVIPGLAGQPGALITTGVGLILAKDAGR